MPRQFIKTASDQYSPVADSFGTIIPQSLPICRINKLPTSYSSDWWNINLAQMAGWEQPFCTVFSNYVLINETGVYSINSGTGNKEKTKITWFAILLTKLNGGDSLLGEIYYDGSDESTLNVAVPCVFLEAGEIITLKMYGAIDFTSEQTPLEICKLVQNTPYIVANKGALVSGTNFGEISINPDTGIMNVIDDWENITNDYKDHMTTTVFNWNDKASSSFSAYKYGHMIILNWCGGSDAYNNVALTQPSTGSLTVATISKYLPISNSFANIIIANGSSILIQLIKDGKFNFAYFNTIAVRSAYCVGQMIYLTNN
jgi:hypothetical protein